MAEPRKIPKQPHNREQPPKKSLLGLFELSFNWPRVLRNNCPLLAIPVGFARTNQRNWPCHDFIIGCYRATSGFIIKSQSDSRQVDQRQRKARWIDAVVMLVAPLTWSVVKFPQIPVSGAAPLHSIRLDQPHHQSSRKYSKLGQQSLFRLHLLNVSPKYTRVHFSRWRFPRTCPFIIHSESMVRCVTKLGSSMYVPIDLFHLLDRTLIVGLAQQPIAVWSLHGDTRY